MFSLHERREYMTARRKVPAAFSIPKWILTNRYGLWCWMNTFLSRSVSFTTVCKYQLPVSIVLRQNSVWRFQLRKSQDTSSFLVVDTTLVPLLHSRFDTFYRGKVIHLTFRWIKLVHTFGLRWFESFFGTNSLGLWIFTVFYYDSFTVRGQPSCTLIIGLELDAVPRDADSF